jgi:hypothetical protein
MKNFYLIVQFGVLILFFTGCRNGETIYYVAPGGVESGKGSKDDPFTSLNLTLQRVLDERAKGNKLHVKIYLMEGEYGIKNSIRIDSSLSNITIASYKDEKVVFTGGRAIPPDAIEQTELNGNKVLRVDLRKLGITEYGEMRNVGFRRPYGKSWAELFVNGEPMHLAKWPNNGVIAMGKVLDSGSVPRNGDFTDRGGEFICDSTRILTWKNPGEVWITGYFNYGYADDAVRIASIDVKKKTIKTAQATLYGFSSGKPFNQWYAYNIKEELDEAGEYYIDRSTGELFFISPGGKHPESVIISMLEEPFIDLYKTKNVKIKGITFECSRFIGITMAETGNVVIDHCTFRNLGSAGVSMGLGIKAFKEYRHAGTGEPQRGILGSIHEHIYDNPTFNLRAGKHNGVVNCTFYNLGSGGISMGGGDRLTLESAGNYVDNCLFHDINRIDRSYRPAVHIMGVGNIVRHCEIFNAPGMALYLHGNNHLIENNYIHNVCLEVDDMGVFYYGRDASELGNTIRHNLFADIPAKYGTQTIYQDDGACGLQVDGNIFYKAARNAMLMSGSDNRFTNNIVIDAPCVIYSTNHGTGSKDEQVKRLNAVNFLSEPYINAYPFIKNYKDISFLENPARNFVEGNIFIGAGRLYNTDQRITLNNNKEIGKMEFKSDNPLNIIKELIDGGIISKEYSREIFGRY